MNAPLCKGRFDGQTAGGATAPTIKNSVVPSQYQILVCRGPECGAQRHSADLYRTFENELKRYGLDGNQVVLGHYSCFGQCHKGPNVLVRELPAKSPSAVVLTPVTGRRAVLYHCVRPIETRRILEEHVVGGQKIDEFVERARDPAAGTTSK